jgi:hypothetical protein
MRSLKTSLVLVAGLIALPAFATGERIHIASTGDASEQLKETLCLSMECQASKEGVEVIVTAKAAGNGIDLKVMGADGSVRLSQRIAATDDGRFGSTDLVSATSKIFKAIEQPQLAREEAVAQKAAAAREQEQKVADAAKAKAAKQKALAAKLMKKKGKLLAQR